VRHAQERTVTVGRKATGRIYGSRPGAWSYGSGLSMRFRLRAGRLLTPFWYNENAAPGFQKLYFLLVFSGVLDVSFASPATLCMVPLIVL